MENRQFQTGVIKPIECAKEGWALIKDDYWILFAVSLVGGIIGGVTFFVLFGAMVCGMFYCYLRKIDTGRAAFDDLWKGFQWWLPGLVVTLFIVVPLFVVYGIIYVPVIMAVVMGSKLSQDELLMMIIGAAAVDLIFVVIMVCFHTLLMFAYPLIVDRGLGAMAAISTSARAVLKNLGGMVGLLLVNFGLALLGQLACGVGMYFVMPVLMAANVVAYRKVFPKA
jgi:hypothetical protein